MLSRTPKSEDKTEAPTAGAGEDLTESSKQRTVLLLQGLVVFVAMFLVLYGVLRRVTAGADRTPSEPVR